MTALWLAALALALDIGDRPRPEDWPAHGETGKAAVGAEFMIRSFNSNGAMFVASDYLVVEVALFPPKGSAIQVAEGQFRLRINGKKETLRASPPQIVAASLKHSDYEYPRTAVADIEAGGGRVIIGRPRPSERFPGDRRPAEDRLPPPPVPPKPSDDRSGADRASAMRADEAAIAVALPEGEWTKPGRGFLFFKHRGKPSSIKKLELICSGDAGSAVLKLR